MELELGLKLTSIADEFTSDFQIAKDRAGPLFLSREVDVMFILTAHLKGYRRGNIKIDINEDGTLIAISGERQIKETVMVGWKVYKKDTEIKGFKKIFKIPDGVILDKIKANYNEDESTLTITMPKKVKGIKGTNIEEIKETQELVKEGSSNLQIVDENVNNQISGTSNQENDERVKKINGDDDDDDDDRGDKMLQEKHVVECGEENVEKENQVEKHVLDDLRTQDDRNVRDDENDIQEEENEEVVEGDQLAKVHDEEHKKGFKICIPVVAGSTLLLSFVVFVIQMIRSRNQSSRRKD